MKYSLCYQWLSRITSRQSINSNNLNQNQSCLRKLVPNTTIWVEARLLRVQSNEQVYISQLFDHILQSFLFASIYYRTSIVSDCHIVKQQCYLKSDFSSNQVSAEVGKSRSSKKSTIVKRCHVDRTTYWTLSLCD